MYTGLAMQLLSFTSFKTILTLSIKLCTIFLSIIMEDSTNEKF